MVEVYPAAALHRWGFASRKYKGKNNNVARRELVEGFIARTTQWLKVGDDELERCISSDDAFDRVDRSAGGTGYRSLVGRSDSRGR